MHSLCRLLLLRRLGSIVMGAISLALGGGAACSRPAPPPLATPSQPPLAMTRNFGPCGGRAVDLDRVAQTCTARGGAQPQPPAAALRVEVLPQPMSVRSGEDIPLTVQMTNVSAAPLTLDVTFGCGAFEAVAYRAGEPRDRRADEEKSVACASAGTLCGTGDPARIVLDPGGVAIKRTSFAARVRRLEPDESQDVCTWRSAGALPPGRYALRIKLPFHDAVAGQKEVWRPRSVESVVTVSP